MQEHSERVESSCITSLSVTGAVPSPVGDGRSMMFKHSVTLVNVTNMMSEVIEIGGLSILSRGTGL